MPTPPDDTVRLPGGLRHPDVGEVRTAVVRELTGADEERLSRVTDPARFEETLLECGVERLGDAEASSELLQSLLVGDREYLLVQIRVATFGSDVDLFVVCPQCHTEADLTIDLTKLEVSELESLGAQSVTLPSGRTARVVLATGDESAQAARMASEGFTQSEINSFVIGQCVVSISDAGPWLGEESAKALGMRDRNAILKHLADNQPGYKFQEVSHQCEGCGTDVPLPLSLGELFRPQ